MKKSFYLDLMEKALSAYSVDHIDRYYNDVKTNGLKEHGFPRLAANIGILMAHNKRLDLKDRFIKLMDLCCDQIPKVKAANDFSVKEVIFCLQELEAVNVIDKKKIKQWKDQLRTIEPYSCYSQYATDENTIIYNWAAFTMLSEYMRKITGLADKYDDFIDLQAFSQLRHLDANNMYRDPNNPMVYDLVTRGLFALLLDLGYTGKYQQHWQKALDDSAMLTLHLQSVTGELAYGGRSQQFIHNESHMALMSEYYAKRYAQKGDMATAGKFKAAAIRAVEQVTLRLSEKPITHVKNKFPTASKYGCEGYAYFDKYMITAASFLYVAYRICDESIPAVPFDTKTGTTWQTSDDFHKVLLRAGGYSAEYDYMADYHYDCSGMGRLHKAGAPSEICLSTPCSNTPVYKIDLKNASALAIAPALKINGKWQYATSKQVRHVVKSHKAKGETAYTDVECIFPGKKSIFTKYKLDSKGLNVNISGDGAIRCLLPVFRFNGQEYTQVSQKGNVLEIVFKGYVCRYTIKNGTIKDLKRHARNRNGHYDTFAAEGMNNLTVQVSIEKL